MLSYQTVVESMLQHDKEQEVNEIVNYNARMQALEERSTGKKKRKKSNFVMGQSQFKDAIKNNPDNVFKLAKRMEGEI